MFINCKEMISSPNGDGTYNIKLLGCQFSSDGKIIEGEIAFPKIIRRGEGLFATMQTNENSEIFTVYIPE